MINKETYKDIGKAQENCLTDNAEICYLAYSGGFYLYFGENTLILNKTTRLKSRY